MKLEPLQGLGTDLLCGRASHILVVPDLLVFVAEFFLELLHAHLHGLHVCLVLHFHLLALYLVLLTTPSHLLHQVKSLDVRQVNASVVLVLQSSE